MQPKYLTGIAALILAGLFAGRNVSFAQPDRSAPPTNVQTMLMDMQTRGESVPYPPTEAPPPVESMTHHRQLPPPNTTTFPAPGSSHTAESMPGYIVFLGAALLLLKKADSAE
jgi:hypothetical protein